MKAILVALDLSPRTRRVCEAGCALAKWIGARLVLLHVIPPLPVELHGPAFANRQIRSMMHELDRRARLRLEASARQCQQKRCRVDTLQRHGSPSAQIIAAAVEARASFIVLGSHGHGAAYDFFAGSTAQDVLRRAPCPVVVVPMTGRMRNAARGRT